MLLCLRLSARLCAIFTAAALICASGQTFADTASHAATVKKFFKPACSVYMQVGRVVALRSVQNKAPLSKQALLKIYQVKANTVLDQAVGWDKLKPDMARLYTTKGAKSGPSQEEVNGA